MPVAAQERTNMTFEGKRILLVENEEERLTMLTDSLRNEGFAVLHANDGAEGEQMAFEGNFDIILLDVLLPGKNGLDVARDLRRKGITTPILIFTAKEQVNEWVVALNLGADGYLTKPVEMIDLFARIESLLHPSVHNENTSSAVSSYSFGQFTVDFRKMVVTRNGKTIELSAREFQLLKFFIEHRMTTLSRELMLKQVWGYDSVPTTRTIDTHVNWLRHKFEENPKFPKYIITVHGYGYKFIG
jgi:two-component system alkaline phosphatase synthesis response regulator PhoP